MQSCGDRFMVAHAAFHAWRGRDRLSRRGRGRADRARARLRLQQGGELGPSRLGHDADARRPPRHRARQSRPWRNRPSSTIRPTITPPSWPRMCARCSIISASPRADVMGYSMGARITAFLALAHPERVRSVILGGLGIHLVDGVGLAAKRSREALEAPSLDDVDRSAGPHVPRLRRADASPTCGRSPPACAARARRCARDEVGTHHGAGAGRGRHQGPTSPARRRRSPR